MTFFLLYVFNFYPNHTSFLSGSPYSLAYVSAHASAIVAARRWALKSKSRELSLQDLYSIFLSGCCCCAFFFEMKLNEISATVEKRDLIIMTSKAQRKKSKRIKNFQFLSIFWSSSSDRLRIVFVKSQLFFSCVQHRKLFSVDDVCVLNISDDAATSRRRHSMWFHFNCLFAPCLLDDGRQIEWPAESKRKAIEHEAGATCVCT